MSSAVIQLLVLAAIAVFLILKLRSVLGTRDGFEKPDQPTPEARPVNRDFEVIEGGHDSDIIDHVPQHSPAAEAFAAMKGAEPGFSVTEFLGGARGAYEWILMAFEKGKMDDIVPLLSKEVYESFQAVVDAREAKGLTIESAFIGLRESNLQDATFDPRTGVAEITIRYVAEMTHVVRNAEGIIVEGSPTEIKRQRDIWTFARKMGANDPNWQLVATGE